MKNYIKYLMFVIALLLAPLAAKAQYSVLSFPIHIALSNTVTNIFPAGGYIVKRVTFIPNAGTSPQGFFYDTTETALTYSNSTAFSNLVSVAQTNIVIFTNSIGRVNTNRYVGMSNAWVNVAANTISNQPIIGSVSTIAGTPYTVDVNWVLTKGLTFRGSNNANGSYIILEYQ